MVEIKDGDTVAVFGCGPVGLFAIVSAKLMGAARVFAIDGLDDRLARAKTLGAECINFEAEDPVEIRKYIPRLIEMTLAGRVTLQKFSPRWSP